MSLITDESKLDSSNDGRINGRHRQVPPLRGIQNDNFASGNINYRFELGSTQYWVPSKSYLRCKIDITDENGDILLVNDNIAPSMGLMSHLFKSAEFRIGQQTVSRISDNMPRIDSLRKRIRKSKSWMDTVGRSLNFWSPDFKQRQQDVCLGPVASDYVEYEREEMKINETASNADGGNDIILSAEVDLHLRGVKNGDLISYRDVVYTILGIGPDRVIVGENIAGAVAGIDDFTFAIKQPNEYLGSDNKPRRAKTHELIWVPPLSIFEYTKPLPVGRYELSLTPNTLNDFQQRCIESIGAKVAGTDYKVSIKELNLYIYQYDGPRVSTTEYLVDMDEIRCQRTVLDDNNGGRQMKQFDVSPSTYALTLAFGDTKATQSTEYSESKFKVGKSTESDKSESLSGYYISFGGQQQPSPDADPVYDPDNGVDNIAREYVDTLLATGAIYDSGGAETIQEWSARGRYYTKVFDRDRDARDTRVTLSMGFNVPFTNNEAEVLLFDHYRSVAVVTVENGAVTNIVLEEK